MSEMKTDMENLKKNGFNLVKIQEQWFFDEPREGEYDFSPISELIKWAEHLDMGVYLGLSCEQAPSWLWEKHPDAGMETREGIKVPYIAQTAVPGDGKPGPCPDHPGVQEAENAFITQLVGELGKHQNIVVWNTWQEIGYWADRLVGGDVCYCSHTMAHFHQWLAKRYGDLDGVNRAYKSRYAEWRYVIPNRGSGHFCNPVDIDWALFQNDAFVQQTLKRRERVIKAADPFQRPVFAHIDIPLNGSATPWIYAKSQDFLGSSCYPTWFSIHEWDDLKQAEKGVEREECLRTEAWDSVMMRFDYVRSASAPDAPVWAAELQGGPVSVGLHWGRVPQASDIRRWVGSLLFADVTGISYWVTRSEVMAHELNGYSLLNSEGHETERFEEAGRIAKALEEHASLFATRSMDAASVGILVNEEHYALMSSMGEEDLELLGYATRGWHRLLWENGCPVDFVSLDHAKPKDLSQYQLLVLPFPISLSTKKSQMLRDYVQQGGCLSIDACPGRINENGFATRGELDSNIREMFGITSSSLVMVEEPEQGHRFTPEERGWGEFVSPEKMKGTGDFEGCSLETSFYKQTFVSHTAQSVFSLGNDSTGLMVQEGKGKALIIGSFPSLRATAYRKEEHFAFAARLMEWAGVKANKQGSVVYRIRRHQKELAYIFFNPSSEPEQVKLPVQQGCSYTALFGSPLHIKDGELILDLEALGSDALVQTTEGAE
ncbi:MAG: beta-galactosidase [Spirochaetales bacterium]|nr:beta-galactosidase [Spirochaetales bacterium]